MFDIITSEDFLAKLEADYTDFKAQPSSARHALNCIITAYHLYEWVWGDWLNKDYETWQRMGGIRCRDTFWDWLMSASPGLRIVRDLANGAKHCVRTVSVATERIDGYGSGPYSIGPYGKPCLLIDYGSDAVGRWQTAEHLIDDALAFWRDFFVNYRPTPPTIT
jgi:hypothetical protein